MDILLINISLCYVNTARFSIAQNFIDEVKSDCEGSCSEFLEMGMNHVSGLISYGSGDFESAERYFFKAYSLAKKLNNQPYLIDNLNSLFRIFIERSRFDSALNLVQSAEEIIKHEITYSPGLIQLYFLLAEVYDHTLNYKMVAYYQKKYIALKNSIYNEELTRNLMKLEADYSERENKAKIKSQGEILSLNKEIIYKQKFASVFIGIIAVLLVIVAVVLVKANKAKKFANRLLENKVVDRTKELETNRTELQRSLNERDAQSRKIALVINNSLATINGLCLLGLRDEDPLNRTGYLEKISLTSEELLTIIRQIGSNKSFS